MRRFVRARLNKRAIASNYFRKKNLHYSCLIVSGNPECYSLMSVPTLAKMSSLTIRLGLFFTVPLLSHSLTMATTTWYLSRYFSTDDRTRFC